MRRDHFGAGLQSAFKASAESSSRLSQGHRWWRKSTEATGRTEGFLSTLPLTSPTH